MAQLRSHNAAGGAMRTIGLIIEGVCTVGYEGVVWYYGELPAGELPTYLWANELTQPPQGVSEDCTPMSGQIRSSPLNFQLVRDTYSASMLVNLTAPVRTTLALTADYTPGDGEILLNRTGIAAGTLVWIDSECFEIFAETVPGTYTIIEAIAETQEQIHYAGTAAWTHNPRLNRRRFRLIEVSRTDALRTIARGYVEGLTENAAGLIDLATQSLPSLLSGAVINRGAPKWRVQGRLNKFGRPQIVGYDLTRIHRDPYDVGPPAVIHAAHVAGTLMQAQVIRSDGTWGAMGLGSSNIPIAAPTAEHEDGIIDDTEAHEVFFVGPTATRNSSRGLETDLVGASRNRVALAYGFMRAGGSRVDAAWDRWSGTWGAGLREDDFDHAGIVALATATTPDINQMVLGDGGNEVKLEDLVLNKLLLPAGLHLATLEDGRITIAAYRIPDFDALTAPVVTALPGTASIDYQIGHEVTSVSAEIGGLPWADPDRFTVDIETGQVDTTRQAVYDTDLSWTLDYSTWAKSRDEIGPELLDRLRTQARNAVTLTVRSLPLVGDTLDLGRWYSVSVGLEGRDGALWADLSTGRRLGYLVGRKYEIASGVYELTFLMNVRNGLTARYRAPSAIVTANSIGTVWTVDDESLFATGDNVKICDSAGVVVGSGAVVVSTAANTITIDIALSANIGEVVRLATPIDDTRRWAFIADDTTELTFGLAADVYA
jgi:hypothetical protein